MVTSKEGEEGFGLVEAAIVLAIISIFTGVGIPAFNCVRRRAISQAAQTTIQQIKDECESNYIYGIDEFTATNPSQYQITSSGNNSCSDGTVSLVPSDTTKYPTYLYKFNESELSYNFKGQTGTSFIACNKLICDSKTSNPKPDPLIVSKPKPTPPEFSGQDIGSVETPTSVELGDMDGDGDLDFVVIGFSGGTTWYKNDGSGNFDAYKIPNAPSGYGVSLADMDGDGDMDIVTSGNGLSWLRNDGGSSPSYTKVDIPTGWKHSWGSGREVFLKDMDGDGDMDIIGTKNGANRNDDGSLTSQSQVTWYENDGGSNPSFKATIIDTEATGAQDVHVEDMDGDGDFDVVVATQDDDSVDWYENVGDSNQNWKKNHITDEVNATNGIFVGDMDGDGDMDILSASQDDGRIAWYDNSGGDSPSFKQKNIAKDECCGRTDDRDPKSVGQAMDVRAADMDGDGDLDVITTNYNGYYHLYDNNGASNPSFTQDVFAQRRKDGVYMVQPYEMDHGDIDGDGDLDVISISRYENKVFWYKNE